MSSTELSGSSAMASAEWEYTRSRTFDGTSASWSSPEKAGAASPRR